MNKSSFVFSPISELLKDAISSSNLIGDGINTFPVFNFIVTATFLKMTGCLEQKIQAICWEIATNNFQYRRDMLSGKTKTNDCSSYEDKNNVFKQLAKELRSLSQLTEYKVEQKKYLSDIKTELIDMLEKSSLRNIMPRSYNEFKSIMDEFINVFDNYDLLTPNGGNMALFVGKNHNQFDNKTSLQYIFEFYIFRRRNEIAHNTKIKLQNLPAITTMRDTKYKYDNYFVFFAILMLIDKIFMDMFQLYCKYI